MGSLGETIGRHDPGYVLLAAAVCAVAGAATIWLDERKHQERSILGGVWLLFRSMAAGSGIWAGNVIALLAYRPPYAAGLVPGTAALALALAVLVGIPALAARRTPGTPADRRIAALVAAARRDLTDRSATLELDGGELLIEWRADDHVIMTGPAAVDFAGELP